MCYCHFPHLQPAWYQVRCLVFWVCMVFLIKKQKTIHAEYAHGTPLGLFAPPEPYLGPGQLGYVPRGAVRTVDKGLQGITFHRDLPILPRDPADAPRAKPRFSVVAGAWHSGCGSIALMMRWWCAVVHNSDTLFTVAVIQLHLLPILIFILLWVKMCTLCYLLDPSQQAPQSLAQPVTLLKAAVKLHIVH